MHRAMPRRLIKFGFEQITLDTSFLADSEKQITARITILHIELGKSNNKHNLIPKKRLPTMIVKSQMLLISRIADHHKFDSLIFVLMYIADLL
jgi:hypothetical protein